MMTKEITLTYPAQRTILDILLFRPARMRTETFRISNTRPGGLNYGDH